MRNIRRGFGLTIGHILARLVWGAIVIIAVVVLIVVISKDAKASEGDFTEPVKCVMGASDIDETIPVGLAVDLCAGTSNAKVTLDCYAEAGFLSLNRGQAVRLCSAKTRESAP